MNKKLSEKNFSETRKLLLLSTVGLTLIFCIIVGLFIGWCIDALLNSYPWATIIGLVLGIVSGLIELFKVTFSCLNDKQ